METQREEIRKQEDAKAIAKVQADEQVRIAAGIKAQLDAHANEVRADGNEVENRIAAELEAAAIEEKRIQLEESAKMKGNVIDRSNEVLLPTAETLLKDISYQYRLSYGQACDLVLKVAEELRVAA